MLLCLVMNKCEEKIKDGKDVTMKLCVDDTQNPMTKMKKLLYCCNCNTHGHDHRFCRKPIVSYGIILCTIKKNTDKASPDKIKFLLIQQKHTYGYSEIIRGKYDYKNVDYVTRLIKDMTPIEKLRLNKLSFHILWSNLWFFPYHNQLYQKEYVRASTKIDKIKHLLKNNVDTDEYELQNADTCEPDWGFPKGRPNYFEDPIDCANREFLEESGLSAKDYRIISKNHIDETFCADNGITYKYVYYIARSDEQVSCFINPHNLTQTSEIRKIGWFTFIQATKLLRYNRQRLKALNTAYSYIDGKV